MGCIYESMGIHTAGACTMYEEGTEMLGCDSSGNCMVSCDPDPSYTCETYESDDTCSECGNDNNVEECDCEQ